MRNGVAESDPVGGFALHGDFLWTEAEKRAASGDGRRLN
jgi:hypothetical protein